MEKSVTEEQEQLKILKNPFDNFDPKIIDLQLADSFFDFDSIKEFFEDKSPNQVRIGLEKTDSGFVDNSVKMDEEEKSHYKNVISHGSDQIFDVSGCSAKVEEALECEKELNLNCCIEEEMGKVSLVGAKSEIESYGDESKTVGLVGGLVSIPVDESGAKSEIVSNEQETESDSDSGAESESSTSSSSSGSEDNNYYEEEVYEDEKEEINRDLKMEFNLPGELEEGEIDSVEREEIVGGIDDDDDDNNEVDEEEEEETEFGFDVHIDDVGGCAIGLIRSKNELQVLPPVPQVNATLQPYHRMLPVGVVLSVVGFQVIVEGVEQHVPLNEGSILWITESRSPLGLVDEIFGPVKNPYYVVRYNLESEIPAGINVGTFISFVQEFANHVFNDKNLYKKGYDASGENDEELSDDAEFSDDEKEAEYRRKLKMEKRDMNYQTPGNRKYNRKKVQNKDGAWRNGRQSVPQMNGIGHSPNQNQHRVSPVMASLDHGNSSAISSVGQGFFGGTGLVPQLQPMATSSNSVWTNGMLSQQPLNAFFANGFPANSLLWPFQKYQQLPYQPMVRQISLPNVILPGGQSNFFGGPAYAPWQGFVGQNGLNQTIVQGLPVQPAQPSVHAGQGTLLNGLHREQSNSQPAAVYPASIEAPQQFNMGTYSSHGRRPHHRGGHFTGKRVTTEPNEKLV